jgi:hypothetical protein
MLRDASGIDVPRQDLNGTGLWEAPECSQNGTCRYGLMNYYQVAELTSAWRPLTVAGILLIIIIIIIYSDIFGIRLCTYNCQAR